MTIVPEVASTPARPASIWPDGREMLVMLAAAAVVLAVLLPTLGSLSLWYDEILTADSAQLSWPGLVANRYLRGHFPTYFLFIKGLGLGGASEFWIRLPSALFSAGTASLLALIAFRFLGSIAAVVAVLLYAMLPLLIDYGQEARPYALMLFFLSLAMLAHLSMLAGRPGFARHGTLATIGTIGAALMIPAGIVAVALQHAALFACGAFKAPAAERQVWLRHLKVTWIVIAIAALGLAPNVFGQLRSPQGLKKWQALEPTSQRVGATFRALYGFGFDTDNNRFLPAGYELGLTVVLLALLALGVVIGYRRRIERYLIAIAVGTPLVFVLIGSVSALVPRYLISLMPATILVVASAAAWLLTRPPWRLPAAAVLAAALAALALQALDTVTSERKFDWHRLSAFLAGNELGQTELLANSNQIAVSLQHYLPQPNGFTYRFVNPQQGDIGELWQAARERDLAWLVLFYTDALPPEVTEGRVACRWQFAPITVFAVAGDKALLPAPLKGCAG